MTRVVLASASPRRKELLAALIDEFEVVPADVPEDLTDDGFADAGRLALAKARDVFECNPEAVVIGSDTVVYDASRTYGKPTDATDAARMWRQLRGREHMVATGIAVVSSTGDRHVTRASRVELSALSDDVIDEYVASGRPMDKAGAYAIQDEDVPTVTRLDGCYCSVMGLGLWALKDLLEEIGIACRQPSDTFERCRECRSLPLRTS